LLAALPLIAVFKLAVLLLNVDNGV
jgi:hypothetical protein